MRKLYIVFDQIPPMESGGLIVTYLNMVEQLKDEFEIVIISVFRSKKKQEALFPGVKIITLSNFLIDNRFFRIGQYFKNKDIHKIFGAILSMFWFFAYRFTAKRKIKKIINEEDIVISVSPTASMFIHRHIKFIQDIHASFEYFWGDNLFGRLQALLMSKPQLTVFRNKVDSKKGEKKFKSTYMYNFLENISYDMNDFDIKKRKNRILYMGRLHPDKDPIRLLECAKILKDRGIDFQLDIFGTGILRKELEQKIAADNLSDVVALKGYSTDKNIYSNYGVLWLTSKHEGFGLVIVEAKANATPVISSNWGEAVNEVIEAGVDGFIADSNQEIADYTAELFADEEKLISLSRGAKNNYHEKFSNEITKKRLIYILNNYKTM